MNGKAIIPVSKPLLPTTRELLPYLERIDASRFYSNFGPLNTELETRISEKLGSGTNSVTTVSSATAGLTAALVSMMNNSSKKQKTLKPVCLLPAWTFVATFHAVISAGMEPFLIDVDPKTWKTTPYITKEALSKIDGDPVAVIPVAPFGRPVETQVWDDFKEETGIEVVIDSAAGFDSLTASNIPKVVSMHATKVLAAGEGGFIVSTEANIVNHIRKYINFGFSGDRFSRSQGTNAKMSEYQAAVALASLDNWPETRAIYGNIVTQYQDRIANEEKLSILPSSDDRHVTSSIMLESSIPLPSGFDEFLLENGIETRRWWGKGLQAQILNKKVQSASLQQTKQLAESCIGLPCFPGITESEINYVVDTILRNLKGY